MTGAERLIVEEFHKLYYEGVERGGRLFEQTTWFGVPCLKCPLDLWVYQEILYQLKPDLIIETGTFHGGSALYLAYLCDALGRGHVATIDVMDVPRPAHPRVTYIKGSSADPAVARAARACAPETAKVLVILDSDHSDAHVLEELRLYAPMVSDGSYLIVEDTNVNGHPARPGFGPGPYEAVTEFLAERRDFVPERAREKFLMTFNPRGYLKKLSAPAAQAPDMPDTAGPVEVMPDLVKALQSVHQREVQQLAAEAHAAQRSADERRSELARRSGELAVARTELAQRSGELASARTELAQRNGELAGAYAELERVRGDLHRLRSHWLIRSALRVRRALLARGR